MSTSQTKPKRQALIEWIPYYPNGIGLSALEIILQQHWSSQPSRRTLQRWLDELIESKIIESEGATSARIYRLASNYPTKKPDWEWRMRQGNDDAFIPLSKEGEEIREYVRQDVIHRVPVAYQRPFLENYQANHSAYLPPTIREHLHHLGRTSAGERPAGTYAREILDRLLVDLSWASSRLEGNTYTRLDTVNLIEHGKIAEGKDLQETQMILNHKAAIELLVEDVNQTGFNLFTMLNLHALLSDNLLPDPDTGGRLRRIKVYISGTVYHPLAVPQQIEEMFRLLLAKADAINDPFEQAFFMMVQLPYLQPFIDVNKRVSRLAANIPLIRHNLCPLSFLDVPEGVYVDGLLGIYEQNRIELMRDVFVWAYERSCQQYVATRQTLAEPDPFRLRYRQSLIHTIQTVVRLGQPCGREQMLSIALSAQAIPSNDIERFLAMVETDLANLHEGIISRYRLRPSEFAAWQAR